MNYVAPDAFPYPPNYSPEYQSLLSRLADVIQEIVRYGWIVLRETTEQPPGGHPKIVTTALYRHFLEYLDGVSILMRQGSDGPTGPLLRSAVEALWAIEYIFKEDSTRRALAYHVERLQQDRSTLLRFDSTTPEGQRVRKEMHRRLVVAPGEFILRMPDAQTASLVEQIDQYLQHPHLREIAQEWTRVKKEKGWVHWFSLFGGPGNLRNLAIHLGQGEAYEVLYSDWSRAVHARGALEGYRDR